MKQIAAGLVMAAAVLAMNASQERTQRRIDELHRQYAGRIEQARQEGIIFGRNQAAFEKEITYPLIPVTQTEDKKSFRDRFTR